MKKKILLGIVSCLLFMPLQALSSGSTSSSSGSSSAVSGSDPTAKSNQGKKMRTLAEKKLETDNQLSSNSTQAGFDHSHGRFANLLKTHVKPTKDGFSTAVDYKNFDKLELKKYLTDLSALSKNSFDLFSREDKLAFLINAYNAFTLNLILDNYPVKSIKDLGGFLSSPWKKKIIPLFGEKISLDQIEQDMIRKDPIFQEPRIHFAVNCASIGCPPLLADAYRGADLDKQLDQSTRKFLKDRSRNRIENDKVIVSKIFDWYQEDFKKGWKGYSSLNAFLRAYSDSLTENSQDADLLKAGKLKLEYSDYDWNLNGL